MKFLLLLFSVCLLPAFAQEFQQLPTDKGTLLVDISTEPENPATDQQSKLKIDFINPVTKKIQEHVDYRITVVKDNSAIFGPIPLTHTSTGSATLPVEFKENGAHEITIEIEGILFKPIPIETVTFTKTIGMAAAQTTNEAKDEGGCLIATATFGTEISPQVQRLREIRDGVLYNTSVGTTFMSGFNEFYYSFSPKVADLERQNPLFREMIKITITPMLSTLSILNYADINSEQEMLGYGIGILLLNIGIYFVAPAIVILKIKQKITKLD